MVEAIHTQKNGETCQRVDSNEFSERESQVAKEQAFAHFPELLSADRLALLHSFPENQVSDFC